MARDKRIACAALFQTESLFVSASSVAMGESYATSLSENVAIIDN